MVALSGINRVSARPPPPESDISTQEYIAAMEERVKLQDAHIKDLMGRGPPTTIPSTDGAEAASVITRGSNLSSSTISHKLNDLQSSLATLLTTVSFQASAMTALTNQVAAGNTKRDGVVGNRTRTGDKNPKYKHTCPKCKLLVWHK